MELELLHAPPASRSLKRGRTTIEAEDARAQGPETPTRPVKIRKLIQTPQLARRWERSDGSEFSPVKLSLCGRRLMFV